MLIQCRERERKVKLERANRKRREGQKKMTGIKTRRFIAAELARVIALV
jgi:hypothetical protein